MNWENLTRADVERWKVLLTVFFSVGDIIEPHKNSVQVWLCVLSISLIWLFISSNFHLFGECIISPRLIVFLSTHSSDPDKGSHPLLIRLRVFLTEPGRNCVWIYSTTSTGSVTIFPLLITICFTARHIECFLKKCSFNSSLHGEWNFSKQRFEMEEEIHSKRIRHCLQFC